VTNEEWGGGGGGREAGKFPNMVPNRGDGCLLTFQCSRRLFFSVFPFPVCKAQLIGDWYENRRGAPSVRLFKKIFFCPPIGDVKLSLLSIIYLSRVLCLSVCDCVCVTIAERSAILLALAIKLTKETRRRVWRWRD
jgi:hypothetical protein